MADMKVSKIKGAHLDKWVAKAEGYETILSPKHPVHDYRIYEGDDSICWALVPDEDEDEYWDEYSPSSYWHIAGPIIEREKIVVYPSTGDGPWNAVLYAEKEKRIFCFGETYLIAAMRCYVTGKYGDEVEDELL